MSADSIQKNLDTLRAKQLNSNCSNLLYKTNITIKEVRDLLDIMEAHKRKVVSVHFFSGNVMGPIKVSLKTLNEISDDEEYFDITDYASA